MKNNKGFAVVPVLIVVLLIVGAVVFFSKNKSKLEDGMENDSSMEQDQKMNGSDETNTDTRKVSQKDFPALIDAGGSFKCTFSYDMKIAEPAKASGIYYFSNGKMRLESTMTPPNQTSFMIMNGKDDYVYSWSDFQNTGTKFKQDVDLSEAYKSTFYKDISKDPNAPVYDFDCSKWNVDSSLFVPPSNIQFQDMADLMKQYQQ